MYPIERGAINGSAVADLHPPSSTSTLLGPHRWVVPSLALAHTPPLGATSLILAGSPAGTTASVNGGAVSRSWLTDRGCDRPWHGRSGHPCPPRRFNFPVAWLMAEPKDGTPSMSHGVGGSLPRHLETFGGRAHMHGAIMSLYTLSLIATCGGRRRLSLEILGVAAPPGVVYVGEPVGRPLAELHHVPRIPRSTSAIATRWWHGCIRAVRSSCTMNLPKLFAASRRKLMLELWCMSESFRWDAACPQPLTCAMPRLPLPTAPH
jgi:hypothetical protein